MTQNSVQGGSNASAGHANHGKKSSDTAWLVVSIAVTIPSALYLLYSSPAKKSDYHGSGHHSSTSTLEDKGGASSVGETANSQMDHAAESVSLAADDTRDQANERLGEIGEKAGELYGGAKDRTEASIMRATDKTAYVKEEAGEVPEPTTEGSKNRTHEDDKGSQEVSGKPNQDGEKDLDDSQGREGADTPKEPVGERRKAEKTDGDSKSSETLSNLKRKQNPSKTPSQVDPPATGMKDAPSTDKRSGKQEGLDNGDAPHPVRTCPQPDVTCLY
ncbi:hypothetical protein HOY82DRAFT_490356 [Tuber indicum]|nr:hypothetical protein HOY82DRAFT_490356 [Tuber indicum]